MKTKKNNDKPEMTSNTGYIEKKYAFILELAKKRMESHYPVIEWVIECDVDGLEVETTELKEVA